MDLVQILTGLGSIALIIGIGIGLLQLRGLRTQRQEELVIRAYSPFFDGALTQAYWRIQRWTFEDFAAFEARATLEDWTTLDQVATFFEMIGVLYKRGLARLDLLDDLLAGAVLSTWRRIAPIVRGYRQRGDYPDYGQWFEYLARALDDRLTKLGEVHPAIDAPITPLGPAPTRPSDSRPGND